MSRIQGAAFRDLQGLLTRISLRAYDRPWLMANPTFARFVRPGFLHEFLVAVPVPPLPLGLIIKRVLQYFKTNFGLVLSFLATRRTFRKYANGRKPSAGPVVLLDTVVYTAPTLTKGRLELVEFPGLVEECRIKGVRAVIAPFLFGPLGPGETAKLAALLHQSETPVLTIYEALSGSDIIKLFCFTLCYPFLLLRFLSGLLNSGPEALVRQECIDNLPTPVVPAYLRHLYGRALARAFPKGLTVVSWWENRAGDKLFIGGLRSSGTPVSVLGTQLYVFPDNYLGGYLTEAETAHNVAPDRLLVNGPYYLPEDALVPATVGPSLRYSGIFRQGPFPHRAAGGCLVLLGYDSDGVRQALSVLQRVRWNAHERLAVRLHPAHHGQAWSHLLPPNAVFAEGDLYEHLSLARVVIGAETGAMLEAVACGVPVINLNALGDMSLRDMPQLGQGEIWFPANTAEDVERQLDEVAKIPPEKLWNYAQRYRQEFFCEPVPGQLLEAFGLSSQGDRA